MAIVTALLSFASVIAAKLSADEVKAWLPWLARRLVGLAVKILRENQRERYGEEWPGYISEIPGDIGKVLAAIGFVFASLAIHHESSEPVQIRANTGAPDRAGRSAYTPGSLNFGLLPEPEDRSAGFIASSILNTIICALVLYIDGAMRLIPYPGPANFLIR